MLGVSFFMTVDPFCCAFFFFQAEDCIRDLIVTGVQTCALPISPPSGCGACGRALGKYRRAASSPTAVIDILTSVLPSVLPHGARIGAGVPGAPRGTPAPRL